MEPVLHEKDILLVLNKNFGNVKKSDMVLFKKGNRIMVKRILSVNHNGIEVRGDNGMHSTDSRIFGLIQKKDVLGKVIKVYHSHA